MEKNWNLVSNKELQDECSRLENEFTEKQKVMKDTYEVMDNLSKKYVEIKAILNKRQGIDNGSTK